MVSYIQKICFGIPGTGKSNYVDKELLPSLGIVSESDNYIKTVFHPEYTYGDFMGKLLPLTKYDKVNYSYYAGHFLLTVAKAYKNILENPNNPSSVALVIDEINRGNSSAIFGPVFQLLDRDEDGWSSYETKLSEMEYTKLLELIGVTHKNAEYIIDDTLKIYGRDKLSERDKNKSFVKNRPEEMQEFNKLVLEPLKLVNEQMRLPPNLSIVATMNTSDTSIFFMDSAFKRRWDWEFVRGDKQHAMIENTSIFWSDFVDKLNAFFKKNSDSIRGIEDKQLGYWFIKASEGIITKDQIRNKLMFFVWDSVFTREKVPLLSLLGTEKENLVTFGDFIDYTDDFLLAIVHY